MKFVYFKIFLFLFIFSSAFANEGNKDISFYTGTFDVIDKEGDDKTTLFGVEHKNPDLFRDTILGKFKPVTGAFITGNNSMYVYTGIEGQYSLGPLKILPSFTPGLYEKGDGKDLGSLLEFKSEIKVGIDIFEDSKLGFSYSHISNNDWGKKYFDNNNIDVNTPTTSTYFPPNDYILFLENFDECIEKTPTLKEKSNTCYPVGQINLKDNRIVNIHFTQERDWDTALQNWENRKQTYGAASCSTNKKIIKTMKDQKWKSANVYALPIEKENFEKLDSVTGENVTISFAPTKRWEEHYDNKLRESGVQQLLSKTNRSRDISIRYAKDYQDILDAMNMSERQFKKSTSAPVRNFIILNQAEKQLSKKELVKMCKDAGLR